MDCSPASERARVPRATHAAFALPLLFFSARWVIDVFILRKSLLHVARRQLLLGLGLSLVTVLVAALVLATASALLTYLGASSTRAEKASLRVRALTWLDAAEPSSIRRRTVLLCTLALALVLYLGATRLVSELIFRHMARPTYAALAVTSSQFLIALVMSALFPPLLALCDLLVRSARRVPRVGVFFFGTPRRCALLLVGVALASVLEMVLRYRVALAYLPWRELAWWSVAALAALTMLWSWPVLRKRVRIVVTLLACALVLGAALAAATIRPTDRTAHELAEQRLRSARVALGLLQVLGDFDGDGHLSWWGGDCAAWDADVFPGALDIPGNGRDEDCDGQDSRLASFALPPAVFHELPADVSTDLPIVLITVDAFAPSHLGTFGAARDVMPKLEAFARRSALFRSCYAEGPSTRLSFPSMFTSRWDTQIESQLVGHHPYPLGKSEQTLAELLRDAGYDTYAVLSEPYFAPEQWQGLTRGFGTLVRTAMNIQPHNAEAVTDAALSVLRGAGSKPTFLWVHYFDAHPQHERPATIASFGDSERDRYDAELSLIDRELDRLLSGVNTLLQGDALVVVTGDHGIDFDSPRHSEAKYGYDLSSAVLHVPLIIQAPFIAPHSFEQPVSTMDIMPTLANLARIKAAHPLYGRSLVPELLHGRSQSESFLFHQLHLLERRWQDQDPLTMVSIRTDRYNLVHDRVHDQYELYDYRADPLESEDLKMVPEHEPTFAALRAVLQRYTYAVHKQSSQHVAATR